MREKKGNREECKMNKDKMRRAKKERKDEGRQRRNKQHRQCTYYLTHWSVLVTTTAMETQHSRLSVGNAELHVTVSNNNA